MGPEVSSVFFSPTPRSQQDPKPHDQAADHAGPLPPHAPSTNSARSRDGAPRRRLSGLDRGRDRVGGDGRAQARHARGPIDAVRELRERLVASGPVRDVVDERAVVGPVPVRQGREADRRGRGAEDAEDVLEERGADLR